MTYKEQWDVLDLTPAESKVLQGLVKYGTTSISGLSRKIKVARTTVDAALRRLNERKLVRRVVGQGIGNVRLWKLSRAEKIKAELKEAVIPFEKESNTLKTQEIVGGVDAHEIGIAVFRGKKQILNAYEQMLSLSKAERVVFIQGNQSAEKQLNVLNKQYIGGFHKKFKKSGIIMEGINGERLLQFFKTIDLPFLKSHFGRLIIESLLPDEYMDFDLDIMVMRDTVVSIDVGAELVVIIRYPKFVKALNKIVKFLQGGAQKTDINSYIKRLIEEKEKA